VVRSVDGVRETRTTLSFGGRVDFNALFDLEMEVSPSSNTVATSVWIDVQPGMDRQCFQAILDLPTHPDIRRVWLLNCYHSDDADLLLLLLGKNVAALTGYVMSWIRTVPGVIDSEMSSVLDWRWLASPEDIVELDSWFQKFFNEAQDSDTYVKPNGTLIGLISPHIDFTRGGHLYAKAYRELDESCEADTYIIFGTSHYAEVDNPFILTRKSFETPLGISDTNNELIDSLVRDCNWDLFDGEIAHRTEHSIEFQVAFLQYVLREKKNYKIVPILCNSFHSLVQEGKSPVEDKRISTFLESLSKIISELGNKVFIIAGVDMAHVGPKFGDKEPVNDLILSRIKERDMNSLQYSEKLDAEGFYRSIEEEKDWRKVCGLSSIYATLSTIEAKRGKLLDYDQALEPDTGSVVTFASLGFYS
jgi:AmmeMemoRadiSam system protein B